VAPRDSRIALVSCGYQRFCVSCPRQIQSPSALNLSEKLQQTHLQQRSSAPAAETAAVMVVSDDMVRRTSMHIHLDISISQHGALQQNAARFASVLVHGQTLIPPESALPQTASRSVQLFLQGSRMLPTDTQTDRPTTLLRV